MIGINNVISVNFDIITESASVGAYDTVVYITNDILNKNGEVATEVLCKDLAEVEAAVGNEVIYQSAKVYFENYGKKLLLLTASAYTLEAFKNDIQRARAITNNFIFINITNTLIGETSAGEEGTIGYSFDTLVEIANYCDNTKSPYKIRLCLTTNSINFIKEKGLLNYNVAVKYATKVYNSKLLDLSLLIGAYFTRINLDGEDTIKDYCYTREIVIADKEKLGAEEVTQAQFEVLVNNPEGEEGYYNFIDKIGADVVNFGGNYANIKTLPIHTDFGAIAIENDITYSVLELMIGKQYLTDAGLANVKAAIHNQLQRYKTNGYLNPGASYSGEDLVIKYNSRTFNVIKKGTILSQGFYVYTIPVVNISDADRASKKFPPIYVVMETQSGARVVEITGEIRA